MNAAAAGAPASVTRFVDVVNRGDIDGFLALFASDGEVDDWGRRFASPATIRAWSDAEFIGKKVKLAVVSVTPAADKIEVLANVTSESVNGPTRFDLFPSGDRLRELRLRPTNAVYAWALDVRRMFASQRR